MRKRILVIDDDKAICWLLEKLLVKNYAVTTMTDGMEGMHWLSSGNIPDLVITDIDMPNLNGFDFMKNLRRSGFYRDIPVVILSGWDNQEQRINCIDNGAYEYIVKPFDPKDLTRTIEKAISQAEQQHV